MTYKRRICVFLLIFILLLNWQFFTVALNLNKTLYPTPPVVLKSFFEAKSLLVDLQMSLFRLLMGSTIGILFGALYGILTGHFLQFMNLFGKFANFFRFIPPLALVPLFILWFGIGDHTIISLLAWTTFFPVWISTFNGIRNLEKKYLLVAKSLNIRGLTYIKEIALKGSLNYILNGARIGIGIAFSVLVTAEMMGSYAGLGYRILFLQSVYRVDMMIAYIITLGILGLMVDKLFVLLSRKLTPWKNDE